MPCGHLLSDACFHPNENVFVRKYYIFSEWIQAPLWGFRSINKLFLLLLKRLIKAWTQCTFKLCAHDAHIKLRIARRSVINKVWQQHIGAFTVDIRPASPSRIQTLVTEKSRLGACVRQWVSTGKVNWWALNSSLYLHRANLLSRCTAFRPRHLHLSHHLTSDYRTSCRAVRHWILVPIFTVSLT